MYRTHTNGELRLADAGKEVCLCGWVQRSRELGGMTFVDLRDRYGITQIVFNMEVNPELCLKARELGREYVIQVKGRVAERSNKNNKIATGDIEIIASELHILNAAKTPPFNNTGFEYCLAEVSASTTVCVKRHIIHVLSR